MLNIKFLLRFFDTGFIKKHLLTLLMLALVPFGEIHVLFFCGRVWGNYIILALVAVTGLVGFFMACIIIQSHVSKIKRHVFEGIYPIKGFIRLAGSFVGSTFLIAPGFTTDVIGVLFFLPLFRDALGTLIMRKLEIQTKELYEYLKLYDF